MVSALALELPQQTLCAHQVVVEDLAGNPEEVGDARIADGVSHAEARFRAHHDVVRPEDRQLLRHDGLTDTECRLQFLDALVASCEPFKNPDAYRMGKCLEERRLEHLQFSDGISSRRCHISPRPPQPEGLME